MTGENFRATIIMQGNLGTAFVNDFGFTDNAGGSFHFDMGTAAGDFETMIQAAWLAILPDDVSIVKYRFACVHGPSLGEIGFVELNPPQPGLLTSSDQLPAEICISFKRNTGHASRRDRGRVFFGPVNGEFHQEPNPDLVTVTPALTTASGMLINPLTTQGHLLQPVILAADGTYSGRLVVNRSIAPVFVQRKSRRFRVGI